MGSIPISHRRSPLSDTDSSMVEHLFDKQGAVGSIPTRCTKTKGLHGGMVNAAASKFVALGLVGSSPTAGRARRFLSFFC